MSETTSGDWFPFSDQPPLFSDRAAQLRYFGGCAKHDRNVRAPKRRRPETAAVHAEETTAVVLRRPVAC
jgi:hypothetical protein